MLLRELVLLALRPFGAGHDFPIGAPTLLGILRATHAVAIVESIGVRARNGRCGTGPRVDGNCCSQIRPRNIYPNRFIIC
jgi:hypothetical protein